MGLRKDPIKCLCCGAQKQIPYSSIGIYCSNACQQQHQFNLRFDAWIKGEIEKSPKWLRRALSVKDGNKCSICNLDNWMGKPITLELDHEDGNHKNNKIENLRLICPNCHSQTITYKNRNKGNGRPHRRKGYVAESVTSETTNSQL